MINGNVLYLHCPTWDFTASHMWLPSTTNVDNVSKEPNVLCNFHSCKFKYHMWLIGIILNSAVLGFWAWLILYPLRVLEQFSLLEPGHEKGVVLQRKIRERDSQTKGCCGSKSNRCPPQWGRNQGWLWEQIIGNGNGAAENAEFKLKKCSNVNVLQDSGKASYGQI